MQNKVSDELIAAMNGVLNLEIWEIPEQIKLEPYSVNPDAPNNDVCILIYDPEDEEWSGAACIPFEYLTATDWQKVEDV